MTIQTIHFYFGAIAPFRTEKSDKLFKRFPQYQQKYKKISATFLTSGEDLFFFLLEHTPV